jgi:hypothetical protein
MNATVHKHGLHLYNTNSLFLSYFPLIDVFISIKYIVFMYKQIYLIMICLFKIFIYILSFHIYIYILYFDIYIRLKHCFETLVFA